MTEEQQNEIEQKLGAARTLVMSINRTQHTLDSIRAAKTFSLSAFGFELDRVHVNPLAEPAVTQGECMAMMETIRRTLIDAYEPHLAKLKAEYEAL